MKKVYLKYKDIDFFWLNQVLIIWDVLKIFVVFEERKEIVSDKDFIFLFVIK